MATKIPLSRIPPAPKVKPKKNSGRGFHPDGTPYNPTGKGGFRDNPQNRANGVWNPKMTPSFQYKRFLNMDSASLIEYAKQWRIIQLNKTEIKSGKYDGEFPHTVVEEMALRRVLAGMKSLADVKEITDRVEGRATYKVEQKIEHDFANYSTEDLEKLARSLNE